MDEGKYYAQYDLRKRVDTGEYYFVETIDNENLREDVGEVVWGSVGNFYTSTPPHIAKKRVIDEQIKHGQEMMSQVQVTILKLADFKRTLSE